MSKSNIWNAIADSSSRELFDFVLTLEAHFTFQRAAVGAESPADVADGELAAFLFETAEDQVGSSKPNLVEMKK